MGCFWSAHNFSKILRLKVKVAWVEVLDRIIVDYCLLMSFLCTFSRAFTTTSRTTYIGRYFKKVVNQLLFEAVLDHRVVNGRSNYRIGPHRTASGGHRTASEFHIVLHRTKSNYIEHSQYHIGLPKWAEQVLKLFWLVVKTRETVQISSATPDLLLIQ